MVARIPWRIGLQCSMELLMYTIPLRDTVAGDALSMLCTSKMILHVADIGIRSPLASVRVLLSSNTELRFSIQMASTGPSRTNQICSPCTQRGRSMTITHSRKSCADWAFCLQRPQVSFEQGSRLIVSGWPFTEVSSENYWRDWTELNWTTYAVYFFVSNVCNSPALSAAILMNWLIDWLTDWLVSAEFRPQ